MKIYSALISLICFIGANASSNTDLLTATLAKAAIEDTDFVSGVPLSLVLKQQPAGDVFVEISNEITESIRYSACQLKFTEDNWNTAQSIQIFPEPVLATAAQTLSLSLNATIVSSNTTTKTCVNATQVITIQRLVSVEGNCQSIGDPHMDTFDAYLNTYSVPGAFYMLDTPETSIQTLQYNCYGSVYCNEGVAIRFYQSYFKLTLNITAASTLSPSNVLQQSIQAENPGDITFQNVLDQNNNPTNSFNVLLADGTRVNLAITFWTSSNTWYLDVNVYSPGTYRNRTVGICGNFDSVAANDALPASLSTVQVPTTKDIFTCGFTCSGYSSATPKPSPPVCLMSTFVPKTTCTGIQNVSVKTPSKRCYDVQPRAQLTVSQPNTGETALQYCTRVLDSYTCLPNRDAYVNQCAEDYSTAEERFEAAGVILNSMQVQCVSMTQSLLQSRHSQNVLNGRIMAATYNLKYKTCSATVFKCPRLITG